MSTEPGSPAETPEAFAAFFAAAGFSVEPVDTGRIDFSPKKVSNLVRKAAATLDVPHDDLCMIYREKRAGRGVRAKAMHFLSRYDPDFNEVLKSTEMAVFSQPGKFWYVALPYLGRPVFEDMAERFRVIIDLDTERLYRSPRGLSVPEPETRSRLEARTSSFTRRDIQDRYLGLRPADDVVSHRIDLMTGEGFRRPHGDIDETLHTRHPFILARVPVSTGKPRYLIFFPNGGGVDGIVFTSSRISALVAEMHEILAGLIEPPLVERDASGPADRLRRQPPAT